jgi:hypothetical protein
MLPTTQRAARLGLVFLAMLLLGAFVYYRQRMLFGDAPWIAFHIINRQGFFIQEHRYGSFITQLFPLLASKLHLPMAGVLLAYSASFNIFYLGTAWVLYRMRAYGLSLLCALYCGLVASSTYFWTNNEVHQGVCWMLLLFGYLQWSHDRRQSLFRLLPFGLLAFLAVFSHPLAMLLTGFLWVYFLVEGRSVKLRSREGILYSLVLLAIAGWKYYYSINGWYDGDKLGHVTKASGEQVLAALRSNIAGDFLRNSLLNYWALLLLAIWGIVTLVKYRLYARLAWVLLGAAGYFTLICITYIDCKLPFYIESEWMGMTVILCIPFVAEVLPRLQSRVVIPVLALSFAARLVYIAAAAPEFNQRLQFLQQFTSVLQQAGETKVIIPRQTEDAPLERALIMSWALPVETMMLSTMEGGPVVTATQVYEQEIDAKTPVHPQDFMTTFSVIPLQDMNRFYFRYDTSGFYKILPYRAQQP